MNYISQKAVVKTKYISRNVMIFGRTYIGYRCIIYPNVIIGLPVRSKILNIDLEKFESIEEFFDNVSEGSTIGDNTIIRSGCIIYERVKIGNNVEFGHNVLVRENVEIGDNCKIGSYVILDSDIKIGNNVVIQSGVYIPKGVVIEDDVFIGPCTVFTNDKYPPSRKLVGSRVCRGSILGAGCVVLPGVRIGEYSVVGAGSIVSRDVPDKCVVYGIPARVVYTYEEYLRKRKIYEMS